jgi:chromosome segregation ATPase
MSTVTEADLKELSTPIGNGFRDVNTQLVNINDRLIKVETKVDNINDRLIRVETKVDSLEIKVDNIDARLIKVETKVDNTEAKIVTINEHLIRVESKTENIESNVRDITGTYKTQMWALIPLLVTALLSAITVGVFIPIFKLMILGDRAI